MDSLLAAVIADCERRAEDVPHFLGWLRPVQADPEGYDLPFCRECSSGPWAWARHQLHSQIGVPR